MSPIGERIDGLFYLILGIITVVFIGTQIALGYVLWQGAVKEEGKKAIFSHGSHSLELIWTVVPAFVLIFIALYQMDVWAEFRIQTFYPAQTQEDGPRFELTARQFEWRVRYPEPGTQLQNQPQPGDLYAVNEMHVTAGRPVKFNLRTDDVQHAFFAPQLRVKQDAVAGLIIPIWVEIPKAGDYEVVCAELCGWGHYKMRATLVAEPQVKVDEYLHNLQIEQNFDGVVTGDDQDE
ncbi:MAG: cytochrome c oxidase subunit II [Fuerstiella sp.]|nr:cytochrome c oxidase subunit II [Fuerstiella sp.]MCP4856226.1 cytochrome c oxidase subunit II [Fuerstiella sp.]